MATQPAKAIYNFHVPAHTNATELAFKPVLVLVTERYRQHLNMKSDWGSGPNPEQSYIISLDQSFVYPAEPYLEHLNARKYGVKRLKDPVPTGRLLEVEIEFERNVSDVLDKRIAQAQQAGDTAEADRLSAARDSFIKDQGQILAVVRDYFKDKGVVVSPASQSKYNQAFDLL